MKTNNRIYVSINGIGYGHASRILPLIFELLNGSNEIYVSTYNEGHIFLSNYFKNIFKTYGFKYLFDEDGKLSFKKTVSKGLLRFIFIFPLHIALELRNLFILKPNLVITDSRFSTAIASYLLKNKCYIIINQLYVEIPRIRPMSKIIRFLKIFAERVFFEIWFWCCNRANLILIPDFMPPFTISSNTLALKSSDDLKKIRFIGPLFKNYGHNAKLKEKKQICILPSGTIEERLIIIKKLLDILKNQSLDEFEIKVFTGLKNINVIKLGNVELFPWIEETKMEEFLSSSILVILTGGHSSIMKCLSMEKPILFTVPNAHTEKIKNAMKLYKHGCAELLYLDKIDSKNLSENVIKIIQNREKYISNIIRLMKEQKDINGIENISKIIYEE